MHRAPVGGLDVGLLGLGIVAGREDQGDVRHVHREHHEDHQRVDDVDRPEAVAIVDQVVRISKAVPRSLSRRIPSDTANVNPGSTATS